MVKQDCGKEDRGCPLVAYGKLHSSGGEDSSEVLQEPSQEQTPGPWREIHAGKYFLEGIVSHGEPRLEQFIPEGLNLLERTHAEQFLEHHSLWKGPILEQFMKDCLLWEGPH